LNGFINSNWEIFLISGVFYLSLIPLSATNPQFRKQQHYARKGASAGRSLPASVPKLSQLRVFRCNRGQGILDDKLIFLARMIFIVYPL
jgi:hypothetical protein